MIEHAGAAFLVLAFVVLLRVLGLYEKSLKVIAVSKSAITAMRDPNKDDDDKEKAVRAHSRSLGLLFLQLLAGALVAFLAPLAIIWVLDAAGLVRLEQVLATAGGWEFLLGGVVLAILAFMIPHGK